MIRLLHTADWHLGQTLGDRDRAEEHGAFLSFLLETIEREKVDVLVHAGDVFHSPNPPNFALEQYYTFLVSLSRTHCRTAVIVGGNHDSVSTLNAPANLLSAFNIHVIGGAPEDPADQLVAVTGPDKSPELVIAAVPFLRDRDLRRSSAGSNIQEREREIREGIARHYQATAEAVTAAFGAQIPAVATGHLFAAGGSVGDAERDIHVGNLGKVNPEHFTDRFCYVALGHLHRPQTVGDKRHIYYCGSPIALSFEEAQYRKSLTLVDIDDKSSIQRRELEIPSFRSLIRLQGELADVLEGLKSIGGGNLTPWVEVVLNLPAYHPEAAVQVQEAAAELPLALLRVVARYPGGAAQLGDNLPQQDLQDLSPKEVFLERCRGSKIATPEQEQLVQTFDELLNWMNERNSQ